MFWLFRQAFLIVLKTFSGNGLDECHTNRVRPTHTPRCVGGTAIARRRTPLAGIFVNLIEPKMAKDVVSMNIHVNA